MKTVTSLFSCANQSQFFVFPYSCKNYSTLAQQYVLAANKLGKRIVFSVFRTDEDDPRKHSEKHHGQFYRLSENIVTTFIKGGFPSQFQRQAVTFNETCLMVRKPALEIFDIIKAANIDNPMHKILIYGRHGCGKTLTLAHTLHYGALDNWLLVHVPHAKRWRMNSPEVVVSQYDSSRFDLPLYAMEWLADFKLQNAHILHQYKTSKDYHWTKRDVTEANSPLTDVIDFGLSRGKFSNDAVGIIVEEVKHNARQFGLKAMVIIDGINTMFSPTRLKDEHRNIIPIEKVSLFHYFRKFLKSDWNNSILVASVDRIDNIPEQREYFTPKYLLGNEGFASLDPYIPIHVPDYSDKELYSCLQYYIDREWIQTPQGKSEDGFKEFIFLSGKNPKNLYEIVSSW